MPSVILQMFSAVHPITAASIDIHDLYEDKIETTFNEEKITIRCMHLLNSITFSVKFSIFA